MTPESQLWLWKIVLWSAPVIAAVLVLVSNFKIDRLKERIEAQKTSKQQDVSIVQKDSPAAAALSAPNNNGNIAVNSPGATQIVNQRRVLDTKTKVETGHNSDGTFALRLTINQTEGIWDPGTKFSIQVYFSGPYTEWHFAGGYPKDGVQMNVVTTHGNHEAAAKGIIDHTTITPPLNEPIVIEVRSLTPIIITKLLASTSNL